MRGWKKGVSGPDTHPVATLPPTDPQEGDAKAAPQGGAGNPEPVTTKSANVHADPRERPRLGTAAPAPGQSQNADQPRSRGRSPRPKVFARTRTGKTQTDNRLLGSDVRDIMVTARRRRSARGRVRTKRTGGGTRSKEIKNPEE